MQELWSGATPRSDFLRSAGGVNVSVAAVGRKVQAMTIRGGDYHDFCRASIRLSRDAAREAGVKLPRRLVTNNPIGNDAYEVFGDGGFWWQVDHACCCAFEARAMAITHIVQEALDET